MDEVFLLGNIALDVTVYTPLDNFNMDVDLEWYPANISESVGGCVYNLALASQYIGSNPKIVSLVAKDAIGNILLNQLEEHNLSTDYIMPVLKSNNKTILLVDTNGNKKMFSENAAVPDMDDIFKNVNISDNCKVIHISPKIWIMQLGMILHKKNPSIPFSTDLHIDVDIDGKYKQLINMTDILFFSGAGKNNIPHYIKHILSLGPKIVCCTNGEDGCYIGTKEGGNVEHYEAIKQDNPIVDTIGAGDVFAATFLHYFCKDKDISRSVLKAQIQAGKSCTNKGIQGLYTDLELNKSANIYETQMRKLAERKSNQQEVFI